MVVGSPYYDAPVENLCYNTDDQSLYFIRGNQLVNVDVATGEDTVVAAIDTDLELSGLDYSESEHCFYVVGAEYVYDSAAKQFACPTSLYTFTLPEEGQDIALLQAADFGICPPSAADWPWTKSRRPPTSSGAATWKATCLPMSLPPRP